MKIFHVATDAQWASIALLSLCSELISSVLFPFPLFFSRSNPKKQQPSQHSRIQNALPTCCASMMASASGRRAVPHRSCMWAGPPTWSSLWAALMLRWESQNSTVFKYQDDARDQMMLDVAKNGFVVWFQRCVRRCQSSLKILSPRTTMTNLVMTHGRAVDEAPGESPNWKSRTLLLQLLPAPHPPCRQLQQRHLSRRKWEREEAAGDPPKASVLEILKENPNPPARTLHPHLHPSTRCLPPQPDPLLSFRARRWRGWRSCYVQPRWTPVPSSCSLPPSHRSRWRDRRAYQPGTTPCLSWSASANPCRRAGWHEELLRLCTTYCEHGHLVNLTFVCVTFLPVFLFRCSSQSFSS